MNNQITITTEYDIDGYVIEAVVADSSDKSFPREIFLWTVNDDGKPGQFMAIGHADEVARYPVYSTDWTDNFGRRLVRREASYQKVGSIEERDDCIIVLKAAFDNLLTSYIAAKEPIVITYP